MIFTVSGMHWCEAMKGAAHSEEESKPEIDMTQTDNAALDTASFQEANLSNPELGENKLLFTPTTPIAPTDLQPFAPVKTTETPAEGEFNPAGSALPPLSQTAEEKGPSFEDMQQFAEIKPTVTPTSPRISPQIAVEKERAAQKANGELTAASKEVQSGTGLTQEAERTTMPANYNPEAEKELNAVDAQFASAASSNEMPNRPARPESSSPTEAFAPARPSSGPTAKSVFGAQPTATQPKKQSLFQSAATSAKSAATATKTALSSAKRLAAPTTAAAKSTAAAAQARAKALKAQIGVEVTKSDAFISREKNPGALEAAQQKLTEKNEAADQASHSADLKTAAVSAHLSQTKAEVAVAQAQQKEKAAQAAYAQEPDSQKKKVLLNTLVKQQKASKTALATLAEKKAATAKADALSTQDDADRAVESATTKATAANEALKSSNKNTDPKGYAKALKAQQAAHTALVTAQGNKYTADAAAAKFNPPVAEETTAATAPGKAEEAAATTPAAEATPAVTESKPTEAQNALDFLSNPLSEAAPVSSGGRNPFRPVSEQNPAIASGTTKESSLSGGAHQPGEAATVSPKAASVRKPLPPTPAKPSLTTKKPVPPKKLEAGNSTKVKAVAAAADAKAKAEAMPVVTESKPEVAANLGDFLSNPPPVGTASVGRNPFNPVSEQNPVVAPQIGPKTESGEFISGQGGSGFTF